jgi:hypothetical protein
LFVLYLMPPRMVYDDLPSLCPPMQGCRIYFWSESTHRANSSTPNDRVIMRMMVSTGTYSLTWTPKHDRGLVFFTFSKFLSLAEVKASICEQENPHTDLIGDWTQESLNESPVSNYQVSLQRLFANTYYK